MTDDIETLRRERDEAQAHARESLELFRRNRDRLEAEAARLREALRTIAKNCRSCSGKGYAGTDDVDCFWCRDARAALSPAPPEPACATCGGERVVTKSTPTSYTNDCWQEPCPSCAPAKQAEAGSIAYGNVSVSDDELKPEAATLHVSEAYYKRKLDEARTQGADDERAAIVAMLEAEADRLKALGEAGNPDHRHGAFQASMTCASAQLRAFAAKVRARGGK